MSAAGLVATTMGHMEVGPSTFSNISFSRGSVTFSATFSHYAMGVCLGFCAIGVMLSYKLK